VLQKLTDSPLLAALLEHHLPENLQNRLPSKTMAKKWSNDLRKRFGRSCACYGKRYGGSELEDLHPNGWMVYPMICPHLSMRARQILK